MESEMVPASPFLLGACPVALASIPGTDGCKTWGEVWPKCGNAKFKKQHICPAQILSSPYHLPCQGYHGGTALRFRPLTGCDLWAEYNCIQVMFSCLNSSLHIRCMLNLTSADSYTPVPYSLTCANAWVICFPHVSLQNELWPSSWSSCSLCLILLWPPNQTCADRWQLLLYRWNLTCSQSPAFLPSERRG